MTGAAPHTSLFAATTSRKGRTTPSHPSMSAAGTSGFWRGGLSRPMHLRPHGQMQKTIKRIGMMRQERPRATPAAQGKEDVRDVLWLNRCPGGGEGDGGGGGGQEVQIPGGGGLGDGGGGVAAAEHARRTHSRTRMVRNPA